MNSNMESQSLACDLTAIPPSAREEHIASAPQLFQTAQEVQELPNGYAFRFLNEPGKFMAIAKYIENERLCCPFFNLELEIKPNGGALWLRLTGAEGVGDLLKATLLENDQDKDYLKKLIQTGGDAQLEGMVAQLSLPDLRAILNNTSRE